DDAEGGLAALRDLLARLGRLPSRNAGSAAQVERRRTESATLARELAQLVADDAAVRAHVQHAAAEFGAGEAGPARLRRFLDRQAYVPAFWRRSSEEINYRRFFNINDLV